MPDPRIPDPDVPDALAHAHANAADGAHDDARPLVELSGILKTYAGITALSDVSLTIRPGEAVSLAGENGSGKSTLIKVLSGVEQPNAGVALPLKAR